MNVKTLSIALALMLVAHPGLWATDDVRSADDDVRKVPKEQKKEEPKNKEPKNDEKNNEPKEEEPENKEPNEEPKEEKPPRCHTEKYVCGYEKVCPDGNSNVCWDKPILCSREVCESPR